RAARELGRARPGARGPRRRARGPACARRSRGALRVLPHDPRRRAAAHGRARDPPGHPAAPHPALRRAPRRARRSSRSWARGRCPRPPRRGQLNGATVPRMSDAEVLAANERFYDAFAGRDADAMDALWAERSAVACLHPGWPPIRGRDEVLASFRSIFDNDDSPPIRCESPTVTLHGDVAAT